MTTARDGSGGGSHGGPIQIPATSTGRWNARQASSQPSSMGSTVAAGSRARMVSSASPSDVDGELDAVLDVPLLEALRREHDERGARAPRRALGASAP